MQSLGVRFETQFFRSPDLLTFFSDRDLRSVETAEVIFVAKYPYFLVQLDHLVLCKVATALRVPLVCARESHENDTSVLETMYSAPSESFTKKKKLVLYVTKESAQKHFLKKSRSCFHRILLMIW